MVSAPTKPEIPGRTIRLALEFILTPISLALTLIRESKTVIKGRDAILTGETLSRKWDIVGLPTTTA